MANVRNPRKQFQFSIAIITPFGVTMNPFLAQKVTLPEVSPDEVEHGDANYIVKTAGIMRVGKLTVEKLSTAEAPDNMFWDWIQSIQDVFSGGGTIPAVYKKTVEVTEFATDGVTPLNVNTYEGVWPQKINGRDLSRVSSDNAMENIEFCVDRLLRT